MLGKGMGLMAGGFGRYIPPVVAGPPWPVRWAPPTLAPGYTVLNLNTTGSTDFFQFGLTEDVLIIGPTSTRTLPRAQFKFGRNIVLIGGKYAPTADTADATLKFTNNRGEVWIEGVHIDNSAVEHDGIAAFSDTGLQTPITIQNCRVEGIKGAQARAHGDVFQPHERIGAIRMFNVTGYTNFQGFFLAPQKPIGSVTLENVDLHYVTNPDETQTWLLYFVDDFTMGSIYPVSLKNVYVGERAGQQAQQHSVFPPASLAYGAQRTGNNISWPNLAQFTGFCTVGAPPGGDYVTAAMVGNGYTRNLADPIVFAP